MRTSGWMKRQPWFWPVKLFFKRISGKELWLKQQVTFETVKASEWTFIAEKLDADSVIYSLGVGDNIEFDLDLIDRFARLYGSHHHGQTAARTGGPVEDGR